MPGIGRVHWLVFTIPEWGERSVTTNGD